MNRRGISELELACNEALKQLYPAGIPDEISLRLGVELSALKMVEFEGSDAADEFLLFKKLSDAAKHACCTLFLPGVEANSLLTYLLGFQGLNPMPAHYYCPHCGFYHEEPKAIAGIDLPMKICPQCGKPLRRDGFSLREELVWAAGRTLSFEYRAPKRFHNVAQRVVEQHYAKQGRAVALCGWHSNSGQTGITEFGWLVLPDGRTLENYPTLQCVTTDGKDCLYNDYDQIKNEGMKHVLLMDSDLLDRLDAVQWESGVLAEDIPVEQLAGITCLDLAMTNVLSNEDHYALNCHKPMTFQGKADCISAAHDTWQDPDTDETLSFETVSRCFSFRQCPFCTRDDAFDYLRTVYSNEDQALLDTENLRKGKCRHDPERYTHDDMPGKFRDFARYAAYLVPRSFGQQIMQHCMRLAWYFKLNRRAYSKAVWGRAGPAKAY